ncbi:MAG: hypothetical protein FJ022_05160 [Chloroflexi bacterium]|nr:hypothetical protein [Chloroflexota bacterium]MBM3175944.1 hypothetical protein [Chloroflexota bacterium]MBM4450177.1 hypothetical protein [Chloroflexota bacterium]
MPSTLQKKDQLRVSTNIEGTPVCIARDAKPERIIRIYQQWHGPTEAHCDSGRTYYKIRTSKGIVCDIYREDMSQTWHIGQIYS